MGRSRDRNGDKEGKRNKEKKVEEEEEEKTQEQIEEEELMKKVMGFTHFDSTKVNNISRRIRLVKFPDLGCIGASATDVLVFHSYIVFTCKRGAFFQTG